MAKNKKVSNLIKLMFEKNTFIEVEYTVTVKETNQILETTSEKTAKEFSIYSPEQKYGPKIVCIGQHQLFEEVEKEIKDKEFNKEYEITLSPEKAFGKKNPKLLQLVSLSHFKKQNINPYPGLPVNIDSLIGVVRTISGGRVIVDFNHPLANKSIIYKIKILREITDDKEKISSIISRYNFEFSTELKNSEVEVKIKIDLNEKLKKDITKRILDLIPIIKKVNFVKE